MKKIKAIEIILSLGMVGLAVLMIFGFSSPKERLTQHEEEIQCIKKDVNELKVQASNSESSKTYQDQEILQIKADYRSINQNLKDTNDNINLLKIELVKLHGLISKKIPDIREKSLIGQDSTTLDYGMFMGVKNDN